VCWALAPEVVEDDMVELDVAELLFEPDAAEPLFEPDAVEREEVEPSAVEPDVVAVALVAPELEEPDCVGSEAIEADLALPLTKRVVRAAVWLVAPVVVAEGVVPEDEGPEDVVPDGTAAVSVFGASAILLTGGAVLAVAANGAGRLAVGDTCDNAVANGSCVGGPGGRVPVMSPTKSLKP